jgi:hypothetical protein
MRTSVISALSQAFPIALFEGDRMKSRWTIGLLTVCVLVISAVAQENSAQTPNSVVAQQQGAAESSFSKAQTSQEEPGAKGHARQTSDSDEHTITVDVWSSASSSAAESSEPERVKMSPDFATAGLTAAFRMELTERKIENSIRRGFPLGEFWIQNDLDEIDDSVKLAALSVANDTDLKALQQLEKQSSRLRLWSDWLIDENHNLALTEYYIFSSALDSDERFQNTVACTKFLVSMLTSRRSAEDNSCL